MAQADSERIVFDEVQIGSGFLGMRPLAQHGFVVVTPDTLTLLGTHQQLIDSAPITEVTAKRVWFIMGLYVWMTVNNKNYSVSPGMGWYMGHGLPAPIWDRNIRRNVRRLVHLVEAAAAQAGPEPGKDR